MASGRIKLSDKLSQLTQKKEESKETKHKKKGAKNKDSDHSGGGAQSGGGSAPKPPFASKGGGFKLTDTLDVVKTRIMQNATEVMVLAWKFHPIHVAATCNLTEELKLLFAFGVDVDTQDANNCTALHRAVEYGSLEAAEMLIQHKSYKPSRTV